MGTPALLAVAPCHPVPVPCRHQHMSFSDAHPPASLLPGPCDDTGLTQNPGYPPPPRPNGLCKAPLSGSHIRTGSRDWDVDIVGGHYPAHHTDRRQQNGGLPGGGMACDWTWGLFRAAGVCVDLNVRTVRMGVHVRKNCSGRTQEPCPPLCVSSLCGNSERRQKLSQPSS